jgi:SIR2-like domain
MYNPPPQREDQLNDVLKRITTGEAILFTGAGFSVGTKNKDGEEPPMANALSQSIAQLGKFEATNLQFAADYYIENFDKNKLINLLKIKYSLVSVSDEHKVICSVKWRTIYTTNYDNSIELSAKQVDKSIEKVTLDLDPKVYYQKGKDICVHINGSIESLTAESLNTSFKLSDSSYISSDSFTKSSWHYYFKHDLERCSAIVFIGYSMYDIEIKKILFAQSEEFKGKTYFVTRNNPTLEEKHNLSKFGTVFTIGLNGFAQRLSEAIKSNPPIDTELPIKAFRKYESDGNDQEMRDKDIYNFLLYGNISDGHIDEAASAPQKSPYLVIRKEIEKAIELIGRKHNLIITGEFGNGKSIFIRELKSHLVIKGNYVFSLEDGEGDYAGDIDKFSRLDAEVILVVDGYEKYFDLIECFEKLNPNNVRLIIAARTQEHDRLRHKLSLSLRWSTICVDNLIDTEIDKLIEIIDSLGIWEEMARYSPEKKKQIITAKCEKKISLTLLKIFEAPQMRDRIKDLTEPIFAVDGLKQTAFAICLLSFFGYSNPSNSLVEDVSGRDDIYNMIVDTDATRAFSQFFHRSGNRIDSRSPIFSITLLKNHFKPDFVICQLLRIAEKYGVDNNRGNEQNAILHELFKFSNIDKILSDQGKKKNIKDYYESLKIRVHWLKTSPHYWLQYGMSHILFKEYPIAETYLNTAYSYAKKPNDRKEPYDTSHIDNQYARILLEKALLESDAAISFNNFLKAHEKLLKTPSDKYRFRQVYNAYKDLFDQKFSSYSSGNRTVFEQACKRMQSDWEKANKKSDIPNYDGKASQAGIQLTQIIDAIKKSRA